MLRNNTNQPQSLNVSLNPVGLSLDAGSSQSQIVTVPAGGQAQLTWTGTVGQTDLVTLTFTSRDRSRQVNLPVLRAADPSAFVATGALDVQSERREVIALPPDLEGTDGMLWVEAAPSLAALVTGGLQDIPASTSGLTEDSLLSFVPWAAAYQSLQALGLNTDDLQARLDWSAAQALQQLAQGQNPDGSWGFWPGLPGDDWISSETLLGLSLGQQSGARIEPATFEQALGFVQASLSNPDVGTSPVELDRLALRLYSLSASGSPDPAVSSLLYEFREDLSPAGQAFLALALPPDDERSRALVDGLEQSIQSNGAEQFWQGGSGSSVDDTAVVTYALGRLDPASPLLSETARYLLSRRGPDGSWATSRESLWSWLALVQVMQGTADVVSEFAYTAQLDGAQLAKSDGTGVDTQIPAVAQTPLDGLNPQGSQLLVQRGEGSGRLYYYAGLRLYRPVETMQPVDRGINVQRRYVLEGQDCSGGCPALTSAQVGQTVLVRLSLTVPRDVDNLVVEDVLPAGMEFQGQTSTPAGMGAGVFGGPHVADGRVRWMGRNVPVGSYQLVYRLQAVRPGEYRILPAQAYEYAHSDLSGSSAGSQIEIKN